VDPNNALMESTMTQSQVYSQPMIHDQGETTAGMNKPLPSDFIPGERDVICGRGRMVKDHLGNAAFRKLTERVADRYHAADSKLEKSMIVSQIVKLVKAESSPAGGGFVKLEKDGQWYEVGDLHAREKVGQR
jgi:hypothetical protein